MYSCYKSPAYYSKNPPNMFYFATVLLCKCFIMKRLLTLDRNPELLHLSPQGGAADSQGLCSFGQVSLRGLRGGQDG